MVINAVFVTTLSLLLTSITPSSAAIVSPLQITSAPEHSPSQDHSACPSWVNSHPLKQEGICSPLYDFNCNENHISLLFGICATYNETSDTLSTAHCPFFRSHGYNTTNGYILLPNNISELDHSMCGPLHRQGSLCSECMDGYAPAMYSFKDECVKCKGNLYGISLYLLSELGPVTLFYVLVLIFQFNITSAPMTCFIMYSQMILFIFNIKFEEPSIKQLIFDKDYYPTKFMKIAHTCYGIFNLDFFRYILPPICITSQLKSIHITLLGYISAFYPLFLIVVTWICIALHDNNFKPIVLMCKPFQVCLVRLRKGLRDKGDIINVFATFFLLTYSKLLYQSVVLSMCKLRTNSKYYTFKEPTVQFHPHTYISYADMRITCGDFEYLLYAISAILIAIILNSLPTLLILFYPMKWFQRTMSKCRCDFSSVKFFVERFQGCYRDGSDGGRDMRCLSAFYFYLRSAILLGIFIVKPFTNAYTKQLIWFPTGTIVFSSALLIAYCKPYKQTYMNITDTLLLSHFGLLCYLMSVSCFFKRYFIVTVIKFLFLAPLGVVVLWSFFVAINRTQLLQSIYRCVKQMCSLQRRPMTHNHGQRTESDGHHETTQPLVNPTSTTIDISSYESYD